MQKKKYWKSPKQKQWFMFVVDGKVIECAEESASVLKDKKRLESLAGIEVLPATNEVLIQFRASTFIPYRILNKMNEYARSADFKFSDTLTCF